MQPAISATQRPSFLAYPSKYDLEKNLENLYRLSQNNQFTANYPDKNEFPTTLSSRTINKYLDKKYEKFWIEFFKEAENNTRGRNIGKTGQNINQLKSKVIALSKKKSMDLKTNKPEASLIDLKQLSPQNQDTSPQGNPQTSNPFSRSRSRIHPESSPPSTPTSQTQPKELFKDEDMDSAPKYQGKSTADKRKNAEENKAKNGKFIPGAKIHPAVPPQETKEGSLAAAEDTNKKTTEERSEPYQPQGVAMPVEPHHYKEQRAAAEDITKENSKTMAIEPSQTQSIEMYIKPPADDKQKTDPEFPPHQQTSEPNHDRDSAAKKIQNWISARNQEETEPKNLHLKPINLNLKLKATMKTPQLPTKAKKLKLKLIPYLIKLLYLNLKLKKSLFQYHLLLNILCKLLVMLT